MTKHDFFNTLTTIQDATRKGGILSGIRALRTHFPELGLRESKDLIQEHFRAELDAHGKAWREETRKMEASQEAKDWYVKNFTSLAGDEKKLPRFGYYK